MDKLFYLVIICLVNFFRFRFCERLHSIKYQIHTLHKMPCSNLLPTCSTKRTWTHFIVISDLCYMTIAFASRKRDFSSFSLLLSFTTNKKTIVNCGLQLALLMASIKLFFESYFLRGEHDSISFAFSFLPMRLCHYKHVISQELWSNVIIATKQKLLFKGENVASLT